ncbi:hypothetical protein [Halomonas sp. HAL1]|nr:hypothetical protein [Halomonas sp. HAL1]EHA17666.1 hypothetical protein HAL1_00510 [Halomonas sp. HAL1]WKV92153.1 hypothetical protein Q3Y66_14975 [Halomonas sp. HAL1]
MVGGDSELFARLVQSLFDMAEVSVDIILVLLGTMTLYHLLCAGGLFR